MNKLLNILIFMCVLSTLLSCQPKQAVFLKEHPLIDLLITNGMVLDGLGNEPVLADIVVVDDEIVFIGQTDFKLTTIEQRVKIRLDAKGRIVAPGFIDLHTHGSPLKTPEFENFLAMGITTITLGQDGESPPVKDLGNWLNKVSDNGLSLNLAMFVGHGTLRELAGINQTEIPNDENLKKMLSILDDTLKYSFGLSTGLEYNPGLYAQEPEMAALAKVVGANDRLIMSHMRNEDNDQMATSIAELVKQGKYAKVHIAHIKSVYGKGADEAEQILKILADARASGVKLSVDIYPYNASYAGISLLFPKWAKTTAQFEVALVERRAELEEFLRTKIKKRNGANATLLGTEPYTGQTLEDLEKSLNLPFEKILIDIGPKGASGAYFIMDDELQSRLLIDPQISISSDGRLEGFHPRGHGAFAKVIEKYVNQRKVLNLAEAIRKMTSQSANILGITDRGQLKPGKKADIIIFNPENIKANASYSQPHQLASGFDVIIVNGKIARKDGTISNDFFGKVLKPE